MREPLTGEREPRAAGRTNRAHPRTRNSEATTASSSPEGTVYRLVLKPPQLCSGGLRRASRWTFLRLFIPVAQTGLALLSAGSGGHPHACLPARHSTTLDPVFPEHPLKQGGSQEATGSFRMPGAGGGVRWGEKRGRYIQICASPELRVFR